MELNLKRQIGIFCVLLILPALCSAAFTKSRATFYSTSDGLGTPTGRCGYGDYGRTVHGGSVAGVSNLWRDGVGCGLCYQVRCTNPSLCNSNGAYLVVTDYGAGDRTDFIMSPAAFSSLGVNSTANDELRKLGTVDIEYQRISCSYPGQNIVIKIKESSTNPGYLSIVLFNVGGTCDVIAVQLSQSGSNTWVSLQRVDGAVFQISNPPSGTLRFRFQVNCGSGLEWRLPKNDIPANWRAGATYDTGIQF
ncbi:expansin-like B1 [Arachis duranensis]|uniref:Expansin-like B1 n=1 Tax=Arachis duranensis TaxID=130453 RepID=A0A6P4D3Z9_ARADU|nr:expansin-like B1 [Arachis duranensis]